MRFVPSIPSRNKDYCNSGSVRGAHAREGRETVIQEQPGKKPASATPSNALQMTRCFQEVVNAIPTVMAPNARHIVGSHNLHPSFCMITIEGYSNTMYPTKKIKVMILYLLADTVSPKKVKKKNF